MGDADKFARLLEIVSERRQARERWRKAEDQEERRAAWPAVVRWDDLYHAEVRRLVETGVSTDAIVDNLPQE